MWNPHTTPKFHNFFPEPVSDCIFLKVISKYHQLVYDVLVFRNKNVTIIHKSLWHGVTGVKIKLNLDGVGIKRLPKLKSYKSDPEIIHFYFR